MAQHNPIKVTLVGLNPRTTQLFQFFFDTKGQEIFKTASEPDADICFFDIDLPDGRKKLKAHQEKYAQPAVVFSVQAIEPEYGVRIKKPYTMDSVFALVDDIRNLLSPPEDPLQKYREAEQTKNDTAQPASDPHAEPDTEAKDESPNHSTPEPSAETDNNYQLTDRTLSLATEEPENDTAIATTLDDKTELEAADESGQTVIQESYANAESERIEIIEELDEIATELPIDLTQPDDHYLQLERELELEIDLNIETTDTVTDDQQTANADQNDLITQILSSPDSVDQDQKSWDLSNTEAQQEATYSPQNSIQGVLESAYRTARKTNRPILVELLDEKIAIFPETNQLYSSFDADRLTELCNDQLTHFKAVTHVLGASETAQMETYIRENGGFVDAECYIFSVSLKMSDGRLRNDVNFSQTFRLKHWPNLTRMHAKSSAFRIMAYCHQQVTNPLKAVESLQLPQRQVFSLLSAAASLDLLDMNAKEDTKASAKKHKSRGLISRLLRRLINKGN